MVRLLFLCPPAPDADAQAQAAQALQEIFETHQVGQRGPWICLGDANEVPGDSCIQTTLECYRGAVLAQNSPTRWEGTREVDWIATSQSDQVAQPRCLELHFSDHKLVFSEVCMQARDCVLGSFKQAASWPVPEGMSVSDWRSILEDVWQELQAPFVAGPSCQEKWDEFMGQLDALYRTATKRALDLTCDPLLKRKLVQQGNITRPKGLSPQWSQRPWVRQGPRTDDETMQVRKLRRRLARHYELLRWAKRTTSQSEPGIPQARALAKALGLPSLPEPSALRRDLPEEIAVAKAALHSLVQQQRKNKLRTWKDHILHEPGALGRWLRNRQAPPVTRVTSQNSSADSPTAGAAMIHAFWQDFLALKGPHGPFS